ncbi:MAG TPA: NADH-quinone oxidoreductase subunit L [Solirubrobacteraceae bacterium]|nr:NADH-quinone oxidoreductase subunit L [Solirubrobacteraceae bacterium]
MTIEETTLLRWIPLLPLIGTIVGIAAAVTDRPRVSRITSPIMVLLALVLAATAVGRLSGLPAGSALHDRVYSWISVGPLSVDLAFRVDALSAVMILVVTGVGFLIHLYSIGYMEADPDLARYFAYLNLFTGSMLILVLGDSLPVLFIGWEGVGLCSYLLIGFWYREMRNADAGEKAMLANRIGDAAFLIGMFLLFWSLASSGQATLNLHEVNRQAGALAAAIPWVPTAVCLLLLIGATGKSAQIPLYVWLPDAMAGPTPVSALIHAATMVTGGVYMIARLSPLYAVAPAALDVVALIGGLTCLYASTIALVQEDLKKILAYSTISQIGYMIIGVGVGAFSAGIFHLMTHAFFKALLFLCAGAVMHGLHGELRISHMGGLQQKMPITARTFLVAALAISGVPGFAGFFSKDMVLESAYMSGHVFVWLLGLAAAGCTAFYIFRAYFVAFTGESRVDPEKWSQLHEMPAVMTVPLVILAVLSVIGGWVGMPGEWLWGDAIGHYLAPALAAPSVHQGHPTATVMFLMVVTTSVALGGIASAWLLYVRLPDLPGRIATVAQGIYNVLWNKYWIDQVYETLFLGPYRTASRFLWQGVDSAVIDGIVNGVGRGVSASALSWRRLQTGNVQNYALGMVVGAVGILSYYWFR